MLKLFYFPGSCSLASHIALEDAGADYEAVRVDLMGGEQTRPDYLAINPKGRIPALVTERGVVTESPAILAFVAQSHPGANLAPLDDPFAFAQVQAFNGYLSSTVHVAYAHGRRAGRWADAPSAIAEMKRKVPETMAACFARIEADLPEAPWVMGEAYTICDPYLFTFSGWLAGIGVEIAQFPKVFGHFQRMNTRSAVRKVLAREAA
ncbi:glutathione S-transferase N-terminal domain-containing protein [Phenylobacterium sp. LH3H17]|uniref:glutathione S-transferase family protein n=1 Tax=Phenylobacterium sp. LH3H17 TaxID=2903901 RepID=UPI0020C9A643|nr:glutathione S-transferase N-terminal domain-containing protein [Phenylobacterium sp. LH3H17]UTP38374.1 glutathione S-transferase N-terminal domain-containing protein [Phenylobacterium sp. LH3H17]